MTTPNVLFGFLVLPEMHIKMILHLLLPKPVVGKADTTLFTLSRKIFVQQLDDLRPRP